MTSREHKGRFVILITSNVSYWNHKNCFVNLNLYTPFNEYCPDNRNGPKYNSGVNVPPNVSSGAKEEGGKYWFPFQSDSFALVNVEKIPNVVFFNPLRFRISEESQLFMETLT